MLASHSSTNKLVQSLATVPNDTHIVFHFNVLAKPFMEFFFFKKKAPQMFGYVEILKNQKCGIFSLFLKIENKKTFVSNSELWCSFWILWKEFFMHFNNFTVFQKREKNTHLSFLRSHFFHHFLKKFFLFCVFFFFFWNESFLYVFENHFLFTKTTPVGEKSAN